MSTRIMAGVNRGELNLLDGLRGWAALIVLIFHFMLAFYPQWEGKLTGISNGINLRETPFFLLVNGPAAVTLFFVLSGFALSVSLWDKREKVIIALQKRYFRLLLLPLFSVIFSFYLYQFNLFYFKQAASITNSIWMAHFGNSTNPDFSGVSFFSAFGQGAFLTLFRGDSYLNVPLWTLHFEFIGSLITFSLVAICANASMLRIFLSPSLYLFC